MHLQLGNELGAFEKGLCWTLYRHMEDDFLKYLEYVPYTKYNRRVYAPKLLALLLQICGYIDTVFKEMAKYRRFRRIPGCRRINELESSGYTRYNIDLARSVFEGIYKLSSNFSGELIAKLDWMGDQQLTPFSAFGKTPEENPVWWREHQQVKHNWSSAIRQANMDNVLGALAGAFLLNAVHYPSVELLWRLGKLETTVKTKLGLTQKHLSESVFKNLLREAVSDLKPLAYVNILETQLFIFSSQEMAH